MLLEKARAASETRIAINHKLLIDNFPKILAFINSEIMAEADRGYKSYKFEIEHLYMRNFNNASNPFEKVNVIDVKSRRSVSKMIIKAYRDEGFTVESDCDAHAHFVLIKWGS